MRHSLNLMFDRSTIENPQKYWEKIAKNSVEINHRNILHSFIEIKLTFELEACG